jgi:Raf kinase inhibitor-like YbhB/YbcL family protein
MRFARGLAAAMFVASMVAAVAAQQAPAAGARPPAMRLVSRSFADGSVIPAVNTQAGMSLSPQLSWTNAPAATQSFVIHMHDMEGARNKTTEDQLHWLVWDIPAATNNLPQGLPMGDLKDGGHQTSAGGPGTYRGPGAPATGPAHHYVIEIFALDTKLNIANGTDPFDTRAKVLAAMQGHVVGKAVYLGLFKRPA